MTNEEQIDWLCRLRGELEITPAPKEWKDNCKQALSEAIKALEQEPKTGHWICHEEKFNALGIAVTGGVKCSECGYTTHNKLHMQIGCPFRFCPNCGAKMVELQESEE